MSSDSKNSSLSRFVDGVKSGYQDQDKKIANSSKENPLGDRVSEGVATGAVETLFNPVKWISALFK